MSGSIRRIKWFAGIVIAWMILSLAPLHAQDSNLRPFVLGAVYEGPIANHLELVRNSLQAQGFRIVGEYEPYDRAHVIVATHDDLLRVAAISERGGYIAPQRISLTEMEGNTQIAYANPLYLRHAYRLNGELFSVSARLAAALGQRETFGSDSGLPPDQLRRYNYTFGMEYFDEPYQLASYGSHAEAVAAVERGLAERRGGASKVYRLDIPGTEMTVFGVAMRQADGGPNQYMDEVHQMSIVDFKPMRQTAYLPYEILVNGGEVEALHMRFRMAVHFPDLRMMGSHSFMRLRRSPAAIGEVLTRVAGG
ncbi:hypothetical protein B1C78_14890 [Thioalkalivibrio denitrificans]|uniref:Uncharacterized protein n=1 Tax=Thioalkalivibrio denitrificans TaxID=108003 RepID=A0A1V3NC96_9GAMM|nr:hypothetical protein [Thioalkalivibrio denitrificans]OOG22478.1 hypothetical protein B1C78_14890 [Thioalkalivibrio denitrificans]